MLGKKVLLVDDESSLRRTLGLSLLQLGYETEPCVSGVDALKKINLYTNNKIPIDYIVCDIKLPDINGMKLFRIIKHRHPEIPIVLITGYPEKYDSDEITDFKVDGYLEKPFSADELVNKFETFEKEHLYHKPAEVEAPVKVETQELTKDKSVSAYFLIKLDENVDIFDIYKKLYYMNNTLYCDITSGDYDLIMLIQADSMDICNELYKNEISKMEGIKEIEYLEVSQPILENNVTNVMLEVERILSEDDSKSLKQRNLKKYLTTYVLLQIEKEKLESIYPTLYLDENIVYCDYATGKYNLVLLMQGINFGEIEKVIEEKIINLDGVLKMKKFPIIPAYESNW
jgi:CheY-like chemotaxis protein